MRPQTYEFIVRDENGEAIFAVQKPELEMLEEEIGRWERYHAKNEVKNEQI